MKAKRRRNDPEFKARVALEALKGIKTIQQIAKDYEVHPVQVSDWKKTIQEGVAGVFERGGADRGEEEFERERDQLKAIIGDLTVKLEFMAKNSSACEKGTRRAGGKKSSETQRARPVRTAGCAAFEPRLPARGRERGGP
jgi:transposase/putative transposase